MKKECVIVRFEYRWVIHYDSGGYLDYSGARTRCLVDAHRFKDLEFARWTAAQMASARQKVRVRRVKSIAFHRVPKVAP